MLYFIYENNKSKNKMTKKIYYFRFFSDKYAQKFWFTPNKESCEFNLGYIDSFQPINTTWKEIEKYEKRMG